MREIDEQIGITTRRRAASFNAQVPVPLQLAGGAGASAGVSGAAAPAAAAAAGQPVASTGRRSLVDEMKSTISRLSISAQRSSNSKPITWHAQNEQEEGEQGLRQSDSSCSLSVASANARKRSHFDAAPRAVRGGAKSWRASSARPPSSR